ncbi:MAG TPA: DtxR family transcriptional regulator [Elusimicrobia bacterium]|nr:DtxR family transcriptional regulator [Elusimicrobiota bacterium]
MKTKKMNDIEEALGVIWHFRERGNNDFKAINEILDKGTYKGIAGELSEGGYVKISGNAIELTPKGEQLAVDITRRHRLAERLLADVLVISKGELDKNACEFEHVITPEVTDAICTLLGHPKICPHGSKIPPGPCCLKAGEKIKAIVMPLTQLEAGDKGRISYIVTSDHPQLHKLLSLGIVPGSEFVLHQKYPSYVINAGHTQIALDSEVAGKIYVAKI